jgi:hypothetical protein
MLDAENRHKPSAVKQTGSNPETAPLSTRDRQLAEPQLWRSSSQLWPSVNDLALQRQFLLCKAAT